ncbi:MAG: hypothetical protein Q9N62_03390 [Ghiorsea sp.]|nr:hypothetical protein [Ghiorsea sp.]
MEFQTNAFFIVDVVPEGELQTGISIDDILSDKISYEKRLQKYNITCERKKVLNECELFKFLKSIQCKTKRGDVYPYIHIEGHGSEEGLVMLNGSLVSWVKIFSSLREINILCKNNLFLSSGACKSAHAFKAAEISKEVPIYGLLAPEQEISAGEVVDGFSAFFKAWLSQGLEKGIKEFSSSVDGKNFSLIFAQTLFERAAYKYLKDQCSGKGKAIRTEKLLSQLMKNKDIPITEARKLVKKELKRPQAPYLQNFYNKFMMVSHYPELDNRCNFKAYVFEKAVQSGKISLDV